VKPKLPIGKQIAFAVGQLGWSTRINVVGSALVYFYLSPDGAGPAFTRYDERKVLGELEEAA
jgi:hypothetical protein